MISIVDRNIQSTRKKSQYNTFYFRSSLSNITLFKKVYFENSFIDEVKANKDYTSNSKKIFFISAEEIQTLINLTDREFKRDKRVSSILKSAKPLTFFLNQDSISKIDYFTDKFIKDNDIMGVSQQLFRKLHYSKEVTKEVLFILNAYQTAPKNSIVLNVNRYLTEATNDLLDIFKTSNTIMLNAPTGVGKSHFSLLELPKHFKNIIIISPLRMVTDEHATKSAFTNFSTADNVDNLLADLNNPYIAMTTDVLFNMNEKHLKILKERLDECELIVFDEQHLIEDSKGFRHKVIATKNIIEKSNTKILYLSGTPTYNNTNIKSVVIKTPLLYAIRYFNNPFCEFNELKSSISKNLKKGSVLFYSSTKLKVNEVAKALHLANICTITSEQITYNGDVISDISQIPITDKVLYISTTKATTGININNLIAIYQYGTTYNTNTLVQLMARLRKGGDYYYIKAKFENNQMSNFTNTAIGLVNYFESLKLESIQKDFYSKKFQALVKSNNIGLSDNTPKGFLKAYSRVLELMHSFGFGKYNQDHSDYTYEVKKMDNEAIQRAFISSENIELKRDTDKTIVNFISGANIESIKSIYNLSFDIQLQRNVTSFDKGLEIITDEDKSVKVTKSKEKKIKSDRLHEIVCEKFEYITPRLLLNTFSDDDLTKLNNMNINHEAIKAISNVRDKLTALICYLIPKNAIFEIVLEELIKNNSGYIDLKSIGERLSQKFTNPNKQIKNPYSQFLKDLFINDFFNSSLYEFKNVIKVEKVQIYNVVRVKKEYLNEFKTLKTKKERKLFVESYIRQGKVIVEDEVIETSNVPASKPTPTEAYTNELQGTCSYNNKNGSIPTNKVLKVHSNVRNKKAKYKNIRNL
jgi:hypothetical protein